MSIPLSERIVTAVLQISHTAPATGTATSTGTITGTATSTVIRPFEFISTAGARVGVEVRIMATVKVKMCRTVGVA